MVRHIVVLNFKPELTPEEQRSHAAEIKRVLESLQAAVPGIREFTVITDPLPTSTMDLILDTLFESPEALAAYQIHPDHVRAAAYIASVMQDRVCMDYPDPRA